MPERLPERIWNPRRQWMGNLVPLGLGLVVGITTYPLGLIFQSLAAIAAAWFGVSQWGFFENTKIDSALRAKTGATGELIGFVFKRPPTALDAHAEIGILTIEQNSLLIETEDITVVLSKSDIVAVRHCRNIHSLLGLGGWIVLKLADCSEFELESRKFPTMRQCRIRSKVLQQELKVWKNEKTPA